MQVRSSDFLCGKERKAKEPWGWTGSSCLPRGSLVCAYRASSRHQLREREPGHSVSSPSSKIPAAYPITMDNYPMAITESPVLVQTCLVSSHKLLPFPSCQGWPRADKHQDSCIWASLPRATQLAKQGSHILTCHWTHSEGMSLMWAKPCAPLSPVTSVLRLL